MKRDPIIDPNRKQPKAVRKDEKTDEEIRLDMTRECEESLLSAMVVAPEYIDQVSGIVRKDDFANPYYGQLFDIIASLRESGAYVEFKTVRQEIKKQNLLTIFSDAELMKLVTKVPNAANIDYFAHEVVRLSGVRRIMFAAQRLLEFENTPDADPELLIASFEAKVSGVLRGEQQSGIKQIGVAMANVATELETVKRESRTPGLPSGFRDFDRIAGGLHPRQLIFIGGRMYMGKTALALAMAIKQIILNRSVLFFSLEMTAEEIAERAASSIGGIPFRRFAQGTIDDADLKRIRTDAEAIETSKFYISDRADESVRSIEAKAKLHKAAYGLDVVVIDNIQLIEAEDRREKRYQQLTTISKALKKMAKKLNISVIVLSQLNVDADDEEPDDTSWAESKGMIADADVAILMHRETKLSAETMLKFTKNRKGIPGKIFLTFDGAVQRFLDIPEKSVTSEESL